MKLTVFTGVIQGDGGTAPYLLRHLGTVIQWYANDMLLDIRGGLIVPIKGLNEDFPNAVSDIRLSEIQITRKRVVDFVGDIPELANIIRR